jgi:hypothetical protein
VNAALDAADGAELSVCGVHGVHGVTCISQSYEVYLRTAVTHVNLAVMLGGGGAGGAGPGGVGDGAGVWWMFGGCGTERGGRSGGAVKLVKAGLAGLKVFFCK